MSTLPSISIITPTLNQGHFIERTIRSVLAQEYPRLEFIVIDGGSTDGTIGILRKYAAKLRWISEPDTGQSDAINKGLRMATGDIVAYLNSDDLYEPEALHRVARYFTDHPDIRWATGKCRIIDEQDREVRKAITLYKNLLLRWYSYSLLLVTNPISQPATFWRRSVLAEVGSFSEREHLVMDYEFWLRIGRMYEPGILNDYLAGFRVYASSKTSSSFLKTFRREMEIARNYSSSIVLNGLHRLSYLGIVASYHIINFPHRRK